jgi:hypothetical protein
MNNRTDIGNRSERQFLSDDGTIERVVADIRVTPTLLANEQAFASYMKHQIAELRNTLLQNVGGVYIGMGKQLQGTIMTDSHMTEEEWLKRYDARIKDVSDFEGSYVDKVGREDALTWRQLGYLNEPEGAADEEMSNWDTSDSDPIDTRLETLSSVYSTVPMLRGFRTPDLVIGGMLCVFPDAVPKSSAEAHRDSSLCDKRRR